jgi:hypothetical protein
MINARFASFSSVGTLGAVLTAALVAACTVTTTGDTPATTPPATTPPEATGTCPAKDPAVVATATPTIHEGEITGAETWTAEASPHVVKGDVNVRDGAKLTIAPCALVQVVEASSINVAFPMTPNQGELVAVGTAEAPIRFEGREGARWSSIFVHAPGIAKLAYVTLDGGGGGDDGTGHSTIHARGDGERGRKPVLLVDHVTITGSRGAGIKVDHGGAFDRSSRDLVVKGSGANNPHHPYPLEVGEGAVDSIPTGTYTGNAKDEILIEPEVVAAGGGFQEDTTMHNRGVPYHVGEDRFGSLSVGNGNFDATLTIEAGVKILLHRETGIAIQSDGDGTSAIRALGTAADPVIFTSAEPTPKAGDWRGFYFNGPISAKNTLEHVRIEYTGSDCACSMVTCSAGVTEYEAAIIFSQEPKTMFLKDSVIAHGSGHGIVQGYDGLNHDWKAGNAFEDLAGCPVTLPRNPDTSCPEPAPACK